MTQLSPARTMHVFTIVWIGQLVSIIGSGLTTFALGVWVFEQTGSALMFALIMLFRSLPGALVSPLAGALVDRWSRRWVMIVSDTGAALATLVIAGLATTGTLAIWHIYLLTSVSSILITFQQPAYFASITLLVPKEHYARANGMVQASLGAEHIISPVIAGMLLPFVQLSDILAIDLLTFLFGVGMLLMVRFPKQPMSEAGTAGRNLLANIWQSWAYLAGRPGLFSLMLFIALCNFLLGFFIALIGPMVLSFTNAQALGTATSIAGSGMLIGSILMAIWGGPRRLIYGLFGAMTLFGSGMILAGLHPSVVLITCGGFLLLFSPPIANGCIFAIWQRKVVADMQGRIFATARMVGLLAAPLAYLSAGLLAEEVFLPLLVPGGALADTVGQYIGTGAGRGIGLMFIIMGCLSILAAAAGYLYPRLRLIEEELPDVFRDTPSSEPAPAPTPADVQRGKRSSRFSYWHKRKEGGHMQSKSLAKLGGFGSIVLGISYLTLGVAAMFNPALRAESMGQTMGEVFEIFLNNMIWTQIENLSFGIGSLFGLAAILAVSQRVVSLNEGWVRWTSILASLCFVIIAIENLRSLRLLPDIARTYLEADPAVQASLSTLVVVLLDIDPLGYTYAGIGLWLTTVNLLAFRARIWPRQLTSLGMAGGIIYVCMMISDLFEFQMMFLITVMLGSLILAPIWYIWMGVNLLRNRQPQQQPLPAYAQKAT